MNRRPLSVVAALLVAVASGACSRPSYREPGASVVLVSIDTLRADALGSYGASRPTSPTLDALARESVRFARAYAQAGMTSPSHASILTSLYPTVHRVTNSDVGVGNLKDAQGNRVSAHRLDRRVPTLASVLHERGYRTAAFVGGGNVNGEIGLGQGFEVFDDSNENGMNGNMFTLFDPSRALEWIEAHAGEKQFVFLHTYIPHAPYLPPPPWDRAFDPGYAGPIPSNRDAFYSNPLENYQDRERRFWGVVDSSNPREVHHLKALYAGDVRYADDSVAKILDGLRRIGMLDRSIVVVVSDHGEQFLEHGRFQHPGELYEELVHVPLLVRFPDGHLAGRVVDDPVAMIDLLPTILDLVDVPIPSSAQGRSLTALLDGPDRREPVISEHVTRFDVRSSEESETHLPADLIRAVRLDGFTYVQRIVASKIEREELYYRPSDPLEARDVALDLGMRERLARFRSLAATHDRACRALAARYDGVEAAEISDEHVRDLEALGYIK